MSTRPARRLRAVQTPVIPALAALTRATPGTLSLGQGMVSWGPPPQVREAVAGALTHSGTTFGLSGDADPALDAYGPMAGDGPLLERLVRQLREEDGFDLSGSELLVTAGSNMAFNALMQVLLDPGDEVLLPVPWYFNHEMAVRLAGGVPVSVPSPGGSLDPERLAAQISPRTRAIVTVSPNNPSGAVVPRQVLEAINQLCAERGLLHLHDEAYHLFTYGEGSHWSPGSAPGSGAHTVTLRSFSKAFGLAGWRLGYAVVPRSLQADLAKVQDTVLISPPRLTQVAALAALEAGSAWCRSHIQGLAARRQRVLAALEVSGAPWRLLVRPEGAFYALLALDTVLSADAVMERLVREHRVAVVSGSSFGLGGCALRLSYGVLEGAELEEALARLVGGLHHLAGGPAATGVPGQNCYG
ncbi:aminotransferase class I/II-fold pyridoxal phosphate-dependent enzyme [Cyanobium sp. Morenito 9A2]|uniref:aminotransferase class I/II-fold pyridoxal phosphate-dependent enzyme n=1 Tax=Cyanobium sp. Morenito 9A2 TaxID=2823718 RepID=UPI0020CD6714|nr:aminotransferase class I/II-fold pyridoxal phosphate-dependent enzyme [Cyanobium sp. Morenito 9A2]MCP9848332.1 aminotransferase class I/II-fold pyridoxal phosphate-dependent enzyme [Cyanobium sp. Morenito 9A2]